MTHHGVFLVPWMRDLFFALGAVAGTQENGRRLLERGELVATLPGGACEWSRPRRLRRTLRWEDHLGYARLAVRMGVPVIPAACPRADDAYWVLNDGWKHAHRLQRVFRAPYAVSLTFAVGLGPFPWPVKLRQFVAPPEWPRPAASDEESARELDRRVRSALEDLLRR
jgi:hypothetical protein